MDSIASNMGYLHHPSPTTTRPPTSSQHPRLFLLPARRRRHTGGCWTTTTPLRLPCLLHFTPAAVNSKFRLHHQSSYKNKLSTCSCSYYSKAGKDDDDDDHAHGLHPDIKFSVTGAAGKAVFGFLAAASAFFSLHSHSPALAESLTVAFPVSRAREVLTQSIINHHPIITFFQFLLSNFFFFFNVTISSKSVCLLTSFSSSSTR